MRSEVIAREEKEQRSVQEVFEDHLRKRQAGRVEEDIARNFAKDVILLTGYGVYRGHEGVRRSARILYQQLQDATFQYLTKLVEGDVAFLEWTGEGGGNQVQDGADSFLFRDGKIVVQTIHYTVEPVGD
ncbi:MAG: nuclear transport factor 2 family protein [Chloroflexota bacterium]|nr:nuclear transport factor 2 family protein [Chloroflexota bacterium]